MTRKQTAGAPIPQVIACDRTWPVAHSEAAEVPAPGTGRAGEAGSMQLPVRAFLGRNGRGVAELNVQTDHVHLLAVVPPKPRVSVKEAG